jgi:ABC-type Fe3+-hydroxamate transport system substrate-binding protein
MKKIIVLILIILLSLLAGCSGDNNTEPDESWETPIIIGFATETITISGSIGETNIIYKGTIPSSITFSVSGFENINWYVNTSQNSAGTLDSITLNALDFDIGVHTVSFTGFRNGRISSDSVLFTVYP